MKLLTQAEIKARLTQLNQGLKSQWVVNEKYLTKRFKFSSFKHALAFMGSVAPLIEKLNHHPDWCNSYKTVSIRLTTHYKRGLTQLDFELAEGVERVENVI